MERFHSVQIGFVPKPDTARWTSQNTPVKNEFSSTVSSHQTVPIETSRSIIPKFPSSDSVEQPSKVTKSATNKCSDISTPYLKPALITIAILLSAMTLTAIGLSVYAIITRNTSTTTTTTTTSATTSTSTSTSSTSSTTSTTTTSSTTTFPNECYSYTPINDATRLATASGGSSCDNLWWPSTVTWVRFVGASGTRIITSPTSTNRCGTAATGWYVGRMPAPTMTESGPVCYSWGSSTCAFVNTISVTNCDLYYVYGLVNAPACHLRYCTV